MSMPVRNRHHESSSLAWCAFNSNGAFVQFHKLLYQREPDSCPFMGSPAHSFHAMEAFENFGLLILRNAQAGVFHAQVDVLSH